MLFLISKRFFNNATKPNNAGKTKFLFLTLICKLQTGWMIVKSKLTSQYLVNKEKKLNYFNSQLAM